MDEFVKRAARSNRRQWIAAGLIAVALVHGGLAPTGFAASPYATELISENAAFGLVALYSDPNAVLGEPTRRAINDDFQLGTSSFHVSIVSAAYNREYLTNNKVVTRFDRRPDGAGGHIYGSITVKFDHAIVDNPANPYGIDLNVFGNAFYHASSFANDTTDFRSHSLIGGAFEEAVIVSVSPDNVNWYTYGSGPYGDSPFPTQGYIWSGAQFDATEGNGWTTTPTDFTKPVNPTLISALGMDGQVTADAMAMYAGAGGGTGIDLAESGFEWIQYVRAHTTAELRGGEIDGFADVRPMRLGDALSVTPENVVADTRLYFQSVGDEGHTAVVANFNAAGGLLKLTTNTAIANDAVAALASSETLATYQLDVSPLVGGLLPSFGVDYELSPGESYAGDGSDLVLVEWNGMAWFPLEFSFDNISKRITMADWTASSATLAIVQEAEPIGGDYNNDGYVDAADYVAWRKGVGVPVTEPYYNAWRTNFGETVGGGGASAASVSAPEPAAVSVVPLMIFLGNALRWRVAAKRPTFCHAK